VPLIDPFDIELETLRALGDFAGRRVIEIGAGDARLAWPMAGEAALWLAVDSDSDELRVAAEDLRKNPLGPLRLLECDGRALALAPGSFDIALFTWSLCCVPLDGMATALSEACRVLRPGGLLLDIHPIPDPMRLEAWVGLRPGAGPQPNPPDPRDYRRVPLGAFAPDETLADFSAASATIDNAGANFGSPFAAPFDYPYFFDSLDDLTDYLEENDELDLAGDALLERALQELSNATTPAWLALIQPVVGTRLRKR
jgi:SAM-dependent methyltransferase